mmetsp:Transcript_20816/g.45407  ORF Transcript_20816/g.45407 Transcript_20816/m.45407 type:complete len:108 (+) Transcript_20816:139-462(+)
MAGDDLEPEAAAAAEAAAGAAPGPSNAVASEGRVCSERRKSKPWMLLMMALESSRVESNGLGSSARRFGALAIGGVDGSGSERILVTTPLQPVQHQQHFNTRARSCA